jgi:hypothetical protein
MKFENIFSQENYYCDSSTSMSLLKGTNLKLENELKITNSYQKTFTIHVHVHYTLARHNQNFSHLYNSYSTEICTELKQKGEEALAYYKFINVQSHTAFHCSLIF